MPILDTSRAEFGRYRSVCGCDPCAANCRFKPGFLIPADLVRLKSRLESGDDWPSWAARHLAASPGAIVSRGGRLFRIPTIVPDRGETGACIFLVEGRCSIHADAPFGCAFFDMHADQGESGALSAEGHRAILCDSEYNLLWIRLTEAGKIAPGPEENQLRMEQAERARRELSYAQEE